MNILIGLLLFTKMVVLFAYFENKRFKNCLITVSYFLFNCFCWAQMRIIKLTIRTREYVKRKPKLSKLLGALLTRTSGYKLIRNNKEVAFLKDTGDNVIVIDEPYDFMIYVNYRDEMIRNVVCLDVSNQDTYLKADFKFILIEVLLKDVSLPINLIGDQYNYMITGNLLSKMFFVYFLKTHYAKYLKNLDDEKINNYKIKILDHNMESVELSGEDVLVIKKDIYEIKR